jgi:integrase
MSKGWTMRVLVRRYLQQKRALGYVLRFYDGPLLDFARFADAAAPGQPITTVLAVRWASQPNAAPAYQARRLSLIRNLARFCSAFDARTEVPPAGLLGPGMSRTRPHLYSPAQQRDLLLRARRLPLVFSPLRPFTYEAIFGLLAVTGLRRSELLRLRLTDFDAHAGTLRIARSKFCPERILPLHPSSVRALLRYLRHRRRLLPLGDHLFVGHHGQPIPAGSLQQTFRLLTRDWPSNGARPRPRLHDFRHTFATRHIAAWSRHSSTLAHRLLLLSRYLGHRHFHDTWWYVSADTKALQAAAQCFGRFRHGRSALDR